MNVGVTYGRTVIILDAVIVLPQTSVAVHVSVTVPPFCPGGGLCVEGFDAPLTAHDPVNPLV